MLRFHAINESFKETAGKQGILIALEAKALQSLTATSPEILALGLDGQTSLPYIHAAAERLSPGKDSPATQELLIPTSQASFFRLVVCLLPTFCSRNNSPSLCHSVSSVIKSNKGSGDLVIVLHTSGKSDLAFAQALAVSRCFPTFSLSSAARKSVSEKKPLDIIDVFLQVENGESGELMIAQLDILADNIRMAQMLVDMPPCKMNCSYYIEFCQKLAKDLEGSGVTIKVVRGKELDEQGLGGIYGVGKASDHDPALVILSHTPPLDSDDTPAPSSICLVGKGIVYDTGGLSIKVPPGMYGMKNDMGGSAAVLGAFQAIVKTGGLPSKRPLHALLCIAENSVDSRSMRPDDILFMLR